MDKELHIDRKDIEELVLYTRRFFNDQRLASDVRSKGPADYVTQVDIQVQKWLKEKLEEKYPRIQFMGEEKDNSGLDFNRPMWIVDPVDGTTNLLHDYKQSAVSIGLWDGKRIGLGAVYLPFLNEFFWAAEGEGAFLNGSRIRVSNNKTLEESLIAIGTSPYYKENAERIFDMSRRIFMKCQDIRRGGSAAIDMVYVACGRLDGYFEMNLNPWDYSGAYLIVKEAGGMVAEFDGSPVQFHKKSHLIVSNGHIWHEMQKEICI